jgi:hypothetical protein
MYKVYLNLATDGAFGRGDDFEAKLYTKAHEMANKFLTNITQSPVEYVIVTTWNEKEADRPKKPGERASDIDSHEYPALPGKMAKNIVGMFSVLVFSRVTNKRLPDGRMVGEWLLRPDKDVWGASVKCDPRLIAKLPTTCPQDFRGLYKIIGAAQQEAEKENEKCQSVA